MERDEPITHFIEALRAGDQCAAEPIWNHFYQRLVAMAHQRLIGRVRRTVDGEDIAAEALNSVFRAVSAGRVPHLQDRENLWSLLVTIAGRKAANAYRREHTLKQGGHRVRGESVFLTWSNSSVSGLAGIEGDEPTPELAQILAEAVEERLGLLDEELRQIALLKLDDCANAEIARRINCSVARVERKLRLIREKWDRSAAGDE